MPRRTRQKRAWEAGQEVNTGQQPQVGQETKHEVQTPGICGSFIWQKKFNIKVYKMCVAHSKHLTNAIIIIITLLGSW